jgi:hypothetical protein
VQHLLYNDRDRDNKDAAISEELKNLFGALCLELYLIYGFLTAATVYLMIRTFKSESFLQEEWMHA